MARKRKHSPAEDLVEIIALLPWWAGVILAVVLYLWLHHVASLPMEPMQAGKIGEGLPQMMYRAFANIGQYVAPLICIIGAGVSAWKRSHRSSMVDEVRSKESASALNEMSWQEFELLVGEAFRIGGYSVSETGGGGADGGVDLVLRKDNEKYLVQCKQWKAYKVGVSVIRELYGVMAATGAAGGFVVTSGVFTQEAKDFALGRNIELVDGAELKQIINRVQPASIQEKKTFSKTGQLCPKCGSSMVMRTAKQGSNAGKSFWGCSSYPQCRGIVAID